MRAPHPDLLRKHLQDPQAQCPAPWAQCVLHERLVSCCRHGQRLWGITAGVLVALYIYLFLTSLVSCFLCASQTQKHKYTRTHINVYAHAQTHTHVAVARSNPAFAWPAECAQFCEDIYDPVCASNGMTYRNKCELDIAHCKDPSIEIPYVHVGPCQDPDDEGPSDLFLTLHGHTMYARGCGAVW